VDIVFVTMMEGQYWSPAESDSTTAAVFMFSDEGSWRLFWESSERDYAAWPGNPAPAVDFQHEVVLALLDQAQSRHTRIEIRSVRRESDRIAVRATRRAGCWELLLPTPPFRPYHIVRINRRLAPVDLFVTDEDCPWSPSN